MFLVIAILIGLIIGAVRKVDMETVKAEMPKLWVLGLIGGLIQIFLHVSFYFLGAESMGYIGNILNFASYLFILVMFVFNLNNVWMVFLAIGVGLCFVVTFLNGGFMPVSGSVMNLLNNNALANSIVSGSNNIYVEATRDLTSMWFMGICIPMPLMGKITSLYGAVPGICIGEILCYVGVVGWMQRVIKRSRKRVDPDEKYEEELERIPMVSARRNRNVIFADVDDEKENEGIFADKSFTDSFAKNDADRSALFEAALKADRAEAEKNAPPKEEADFEDPRKTEVIDQAAEQAVSTKAEPVKEAAAVKEPAPIRQTEQPSIFSVTEKRYADYSRDIADNKAQSRKRDDGMTKRYAGEPVSFGDRSTARFNVSDIRKNFGYQPEEHQWVSPTAVDTAAAKRQAETDAVEEKPKAKLDSRFSEEEMLNIWQQQATDILKNKRAKKTYSDNVSPFMIQDEKDREAEMLKRREAAQKAAEEKREALMPQWDAYKDNYFGNTDQEKEMIEKTEVKQQQASEPELPLSFVQPETMKTPEERLEDLEKERQGFRKVELVIDGRKVSFWQRKKQD